MRKNLFLLSMAALVITACVNDIPANPFLQQLLEADSDDTEITSNEKVNAAVPVITAHPQSAVYSYNGMATALTVSASASDGGTLSYQWYRNDSVIPGATETSYTPPTNIWGTVFYHVEVTNTIADNGDGGNKTAAALSNTAEIWVDEKIHAAVPFIAAHPQSAMYKHMSTAATLIVSASVNDGGTLSYQWYRNTVNSNTGGMPIPGATGANYTPPTDTEGREYYYVVITNTITDNGDGGNKIAEVRSNTAEITVNEKENAAYPVISQPQGAAYTYGDTVGALTVSASVNDGGTLSYQWYRSALNSNEGGTAIPGETGTSYMPPDNADTVFYYVVVTNTIADNGDGGNKIAEVHSNAAKVTIARRPVTITVTVDNKIYDRTLTAPVTGATINGDLYRGELIAVPGTATFANWNVGSGKAVTFSGWSLGGSEAGNYTLSAQPAGVTANITARPVTISPNVGNKEYDGTTKATVIGTVINGNLDGVNLTAAGTAVFTDANVGSRTVMFSGWSLAGSAVNNYTLTAQPESATANIIPKTLILSVSGSAALSPLVSDSLATVVVSGLVAPDTATISCSPPSGITFDGGTNTITYNGTTAFTNPSVTLSFAVSAVSNYAGSAVLTVTVFDGQANYTGSGNDRRIPVRQSNIAAFNTYARTTTGLTRHYKLTENVMLSGNWTAIGTYSNPFTGTFNGQGCTIANLTINTAGGAQGMFGAIASSSIVQNLGLVGVSISGDGGCVGGLVGNNNGTVQNCYVTGSVSGNGVYLGGLVGYNNGFVQNCYTTSSVSGNSDYVGGLVGYNINDYFGEGNVRNCYATGNVSGNFRNGGGLVGYNGLGSVNWWEEEKGDVANCYATGNVTSTASVDNYIGGVVGYNEGKIYACYATGNVNGNSYAGGLVGYNYNYVRSCYATGNVSGAYAGGVVGLNTYRVLNCYATGSVSGDSYAGGVVGCQKDLSGGETFVQACYATGNVSGAYAGGVLGYNYNPDYYSVVRGCIALNSRVTAYNAIGRVIGNGMDWSGDYNYARSTGMTLTCNGVTYTPTSRYHGKDGGDTSTYDISSLLESIWGLNFLYSWDWNAGTNLPVLKNVGGLQNHTVQ